MTGPLALIVEDPEGGYEVVDSRDGGALAWRSELFSANEVAAFLNSTYPSGAVAPARDSLVHEIVGYRISGEPALSLESAIDSGKLRACCPGLIPVGPGWDHLLAGEEV